MADDKIKIATLEKDLSAAKQMIAERDTEIEKLNKSNTELAKEFENFKDITKTQIEKIKNNGITIIEGLSFEYENKKYRFTKARFGLFGHKGMFDAKEIVKDTSKFKEVIAEIFDKKMGIVEEITANTKEKESNTKNKN